MMGVCGLAFVGVSLVLSYQCHPLPDSNGHTDQSLPKVEHEAPVPRRQVLVRSRPGQGTGSAVIMGATDAPDAMVFRFASRPATKPSDQKTHAGSEDTPSPDSRTPDGAGRKLYRTMLAKAKAGVAEGPTDPMTDKAPVTDQTANNSPDFKMPPLPDETRTVAEISHLQKTVHELKTALATLNERLAARDGPQH